MTDPTTKLLADQLGRLAGKRFLGAWLVARVLPDNVGKAEFLVSQPPEQVVARGRRLIEERGRLLGPDELPRGPTTVAGLVGAGGMKLNPTVATIQVVAVASGSKVTVLAVAKEGLIKQRAGEEVADWIRRSLANVGAGAGREGP